MVRKYDSPGCQCCEDCCYPCAGGLCVQTATVTISGFPDTIVHAPLGSPLSTRYRTTLTGFAAINGAYELNQDVVCAREQISIEIPINGSEELFNPDFSVFDWETLSTGGYLARLVINRTFWDFQILENSGTPFYYGNTRNDWEISFRGGFLLCPPPWDATIIRGFAGTTIFQRTQAVGVLV